MPFTNNQIVEIASSQFRALARVRNIEGDRLHVAIERGGYLPWSDEPVLVRHLGDTAGVDARILHAAGVTALIELLVVTPASTDRLPNVRDTLTDEA